jgi:hypothetical protein
MVFSVKEDGNGKKNNEFAVTNLNLGFITPISVNFAIFII